MVSRFLDLRAPHGEHAKMPVLVRGRGRFLGQHAEVGDLRESVVRQQNDGRVLIGQCQMPFEHHVVEAIARGHYLVVAFIALRIYMLLLRRMVLGAEVALW